MRKIMKASEKQIGLVKFKTNWVMKATHIVLLNKYIVPAVVW